VSASVFGVVDTSVFIAAEKGRGAIELPPRGAISVITLAELRLGVLMASEPEEHARRLRTLTTVGSMFEPLPITVEVVDAFSEIVAEARMSGRRPKAMDAWIAATAVTHGLPVYTRDRDFDGLKGVAVVKV